jgi:hypothetical protein
LDSDYGAGFWLPPQSTKTDQSPACGMDHLPGDAYFGLGYLGQYLIMIPSQDLIIARFGATVVRGDKPGAGVKNNGVDRLVADVLKARDYRATK